MSLGLPGRPPHVQSMAGGAASLSGHGSPVGTHLPVSVGRPVRRDDHRNVAARTVPTSPMATDVTGRPESMLKLKSDR